MSSPLISIIVPVYNTEQYFERCITSILSQSYKNIEVIVVNDGSLGNIKEQIKKYLDDDRVRFICSENNIGLLRARVLGTSYATGKYIAFVDSDDYVSLDYFRGLLQKAEETEADIVIGRTVWVNKTEKFIYNLHYSCFDFDILNGEDAKKCFFQQEASCYSWHTIWNKIYRKDLWDKCFPEFKKVDEHIVMTEDIYFSSILFCQKPTIAKVENDAYFYCINENASTNSQNITYKKFQKNIKDIIKVFNMVDDYFLRTEELPEILEHFQRARERYARMWMKLAGDVFKSDDLVGAKRKVNELCSISESDTNDYFFESIKTPWNGGLEYIKERIICGNEKNLSFDIFDTLVVRPFYEPKDLFQLLNLEFSNLEKNNILFSRIRIEGERLAREYYGYKYGYADITLDEIYEYISKHYSISNFSIDRIRELEKQLEINFAQTRNAGRELFCLAKELGKNVILISDMYLDRVTIQNILEKCGIDEFDSLYISSEERKLKYDGSLFRHVLAQNNIAYNDILHIGDSWQADIEGARKEKIESVFFPKAREVYENRIEGYNTNNCSKMAETVCSDAVEYQKIWDDLGFRSMQALICQKYFDNPYRSFNVDSDFNADPSLIGYGLVGMHLMAVSKWLLHHINRRKDGRLILLARDGYLPHEALRRIAKVAKLNIKCDYIHASRKALMPYIVKERINFFQLPVEYHSHTPFTMLNVLSFACKGINNKEVIDVLKRNSIEGDKCFKTLDEFHRFIKLFLNEMYSEEKHLQAKELVKQYYSQIQKDDLVFDLGYSGRIHSAICEALGFSADAIFIHEDYQYSIHNKAYGKYNIEKFYDYVPAVSGLMREHIFSEAERACVGFEINNNVVYPVFEKEFYEYTDRFIVEKIQNNALIFIEDFMKLFNGCFPVISFSEYAVSLPFEGFLRHPRRMDMHIFSESYFEDLVYGARQKINIEHFANNHICRLENNRITCNVDNSYAYATGFSDKSVIDVLNQIPQWKRAFIWLLFDKTIFRRKILANIRRIFKYRK